MSISCESCTSSPHKAQLKTISQIPDSRICVCTRCGAYWEQSSQGLELLVSGDPERRKKEVML